MTGVVPNILTLRYLQNLFDQVITGRKTSSIVSLRFSMVSAEMKTNKLNSTIETLYEVIEIGGGFRTVELIDFVCFSRIYFRK